MPLPEMLALARAEMAVVDPVGPQQPGVCLSQLQPVAEQLSGRRLGGVPIRIGPVRG